MSFKIAKHALFHKVLYPGNSQEAHGQCVPSLEFPILETIPDLPSPGEDTARDQQEVATRVTDGHEHFHLSKRETKVRSVSRDHTVL